MTTVEAVRGITGGIDTHRDVHVAAALDPLGGCWEQRALRLMLPATRRCSAGPRASGT
jgi:hypothetical protein